MPKTAIVTGASSGIGRESAIALCKAGWNVVLAARREDALNETAALCGSAEKCLVVVGSVADEAFVKTLFSKTVARFGRVDLLFNNAGSNAPALPLEDMTLEMFQNVISVNLVGSFLCAREAVKAFKSQTPIGGRIINNGSLSAHTPRPNSAPYTTSKHAIAGLSKSIALDGRAFDITCTQLDIGNAETPLTARMHMGVLQPDGRRMAESTFDVAHVGEAVVHIAGLPADVAVPQFTIMASKAPFLGRG
ncbi:hypothetical protein MSAN_01394800 [Mycena sanguinolenta]|uniref:Short-chain dehydrogenase/reductase SDR n=1 Tax=Mycena sanguinolenta TaxID=230812 RepID=A0A8H7CYC3_9AGAR|nr:hypothetical protein MSAN_01394800 [Mycena sanguinolenta]